ncbi:hypothetical protein LJC36_05815 [Desulfovibrio sp. OttesenSCG-928-C14]|nr:hypothetical protein [Desulfovibrio sp. OttesenSCG-928-C14]
MPRNLKRRGRVNALLRRFLRQLEHFNFEKVEMLWRRASAARKRTAQRAFSKGGFRLYVCKKNRMPLLFLCYAKV